MKKLALMLSAFVVLAASLVATSCNLNKLQSLLGPEDEWEMAEVEYSEGKKVTLYARYGSAEKTVKLGSNSSDEPVDVTLVEGLNVLLVADENNKNDIFGAVTGNKTPFYLFTCKKGQKLSFGKEKDTDESETEVTLSKSIWTLMYLGNDWEEVSNTMMPLTKFYTNYESVAELKDGFNFKKILKKIAANKLLEMLEEDEKSSKE